MNTVRFTTCTGSVAAVSLLVAACASDDARRDGGLASPEAVIACSDHVFWGTVRGTTERAGGLHVTFTVDDWVRPASGDLQVTLVADDPTENVGAPDWTTSERLLVIDGRESPLEWIQGEAAEEFVAAWEAADSSLSCPEHY
ncbi:hypothetical protein SAMN04515665_12530 [Blastococcus sp. DSM 46786]|uniref:hypothetical protein n=1 Tax=Blastococcus sp. DSM 46786 TaxID=1798227 RepID=UPI0008C570D4|nr:hypothetical protein [Blastococcus sp. DSM 46786]SEL98685.1 hypothetical protein SAMN04515665_12530 [Blastococcus sp. DSM 46786]